MELTENQKQVLVTGFVGDGCFPKNKDKHNVYVTSSINRDLLELKSFLLGDLSLGVKEIKQYGWGSKPLYGLTSKATPKITEFYELGLEDALQEMNDLGFALWMYDDGSLHKKNYFYNICTHKYDEQTHTEVLVPFLESRGLQPKILTEKKKDGRVFYYCYVSKHSGASEISTILYKHPVESMRYKMWSEDYLMIYKDLTKELAKREIVVNNTHLSILVKKLLTGGEVDYTKLK